jgi:hypothetical protein
MRRILRRATASAGLPRMRLPPARFVLLLTATPHSGDPPRFTRCAASALWPAAIPVLFRRDRRRPASSAPGACI